MTKALTISRLLIFNSRLALKCKKGLTKVYICLF